MITFGVVFGIAALIMVIARYKNRAFYEQDRINRDVDRGRMNRYVGREMEVINANDTEDFDDDARI